MAFFSSEKLKPRKIEVDQSHANCDSPEVQKRLERIEKNYQQLDDILAELESKMESDDRLRAIDEANADDFEAEFGIRRKRKWKSTGGRRAKTKRSANPRKPR